MFLSSFLHLIDGEIFDSPHLHQRKALETASFRGFFYIQIPIMGTIWGLLTNFYLIKSSSGIEHVHLIGGLFLFGFDKMGVGTKGDVLVGMAEASAKRYHVHTRRNEQGCICMAQLVICDLWQLMTFEELNKPFIGPVWVHRRTVFMDEHMKVVTPHNTQPQ